MRLASFLALSSLAAAQGSGPAASRPGASAVTVDAQILRGEPVRGELRAVGPEEVQVGVSGGALRTIPTRDLVSLQFGSVTPRAAGSARVELAGGDVVVGPISGGKGDVLEVLLAGVAVRLPVEAIRRVDFPDRVPPGVPELPAPASGDRLFKRSRGGGVDPVNGTLVAFQEKSVEFESPVIGRATIAYDDLFALTIAPLDAAPEPQEPAGAVVLLAPEGRLSGRLAGFADGVISLDSPSLKRVTISARAARGIRFRSDRFTEVSELDPVEVVETPYFGDAPLVKFPWQRNRSVSGGPLRVGGVEFATGLGVHSRCALTYELDGRFSGFASKVGIDDETQQLPRRGSVVFRVLGDGRTLWESRVVRGGERALAVPEIAVAGARRLTLEVDYADGLDIADRADWCEPILLREPARAAR